MMFVQRCLVSALLLASWHVAEAKAQQITYEPVDVVQLLGGYVGDGKFVETAALFWLAPDGAFINVDRPSARPPMKVEFSKVNADSVRKLQERCSSDNQFRGGCDVLIQGQTARADRQVLIADEIRMTSKPN